MSFKTILKEPFEYKKIDWRHYRYKQKDNQPSKPAHPHAARVGKSQKARDWKEATRRILVYLRKRQSAIFVVMALVIISSLLMLVGPFLIGVIIDNYIIPMTFDGLGTILLLLFASFVGLSIATFFQNFIMVRIAQATIYEIRRDLFNHLQQLPIRFFDKRQHGDIMSRVTNDIENISATLNSSIVQILSSVVTFIGILAVMLWLSPILTIVTMTVIPLMFYGLKWITKRTQVFFKEQQRTLGIVNGYSEETIAGQQMVKTFSREDTVIDGFTQRNEALKVAGFWAQTYSGFIPKVMNVLNNLSFAVIAFVGGVMAVNQVAGVTVGMIVIFVEYARQFTRPLNDLANQFNALLSALAGAERVFEIMDQKPEEETEEGSVQSDLQGHVAFERVSFSYAQSPILKDVSFSVVPGETVAFVGPTGAGKTTIINLLTRFYDVNQGAITIDGVDIRKRNRADLRSQMGVVLQDSFLFQGTILDNIRYGRLTATDEEVYEAAKLANAHSFIKRLPKGYKTALKQDGGGISQGQRQLVSIARALLADPKLLILDEATSSIDTVTEMKIQEALKRLMHGRTSFVIAHRLNTIEAADKILVLQAGELTEMGSHRELMEKKGFYYELQRTKNMDAIL
ncbi:MULTISPECIES: ABC transporter ATP-binding protein [Bacillaceae]|uniref:ABC transporter ATP-binding protein n=1 Tax=Shouchella oshimensis TaxID=290588 RepID=UPI00099575E5|nr:MULTISPECIES: ABC transporter ATP-binding protein [Bacillaceae]